MVRVPTLYDRTTLLDKTGVMSYVRSFPSEITLPLSCLPNRTITKKESKES